MPIDANRLQAVNKALADAQTAYEMALRAQSAAVQQQAAAPDSRTASAQVRTASTVVVNAQATLDAARRQLDAVRLEQLQQINTGDRFLGILPGTQVISLFPVGLEAKLDAGRRLRLRVWPDAISTSTHDPRLIASEVDEGKRYWRSVAAASNEDAHRQAWRELADVLGPTRAAWVARVLTPANQNAISATVEPAFPPVPMQDDNAPFVARASVLPDRWIVIGIRDNVKVVEAAGAFIPLDLAVGFDTTPSETSALTNREGEPIQLPPRMRWMTDFATAVQSGMALDIPLAAGVDRLDLLFVFGVRLTATPADSATILTDLLTGHRFSRGLAFVPQDTPTNNSVAGGSGMPSRGERVEQAFEFERKPRAFSESALANGSAAAAAFGLAPASFAAMPAAGATQIANEPAGFEQEVARAMQTALWQVTLGAAFEDFIGLDDSRTNALREHFRNYVRAAGPIPAIRVGRQPYGVLPVTSVSDFTAAAADGIDARMLPILRAARSWFGMLRQGDLFDGTAEDAMRYLGRSVRLFSETTRQDPGAAGQNRWSTLAASLAVASRNTIRNTWRTSSMLNTVEAQPQPVTRPIVDDTTAADLTRLAASTPAAILTAPQPSSLLARMLRHAALLEWGRLARSVCEAALDPRSRLILQENAQNGIDLYLTTLTAAMAPEPPAPPAPPSGPIRPPIGPLTPVSPIVRVGARRTGPDGPIDPTEPPDPVEPPVVDPPRPPPLPPGTPEVDATERQRIRTLVGDLAKPLASCPGAPRLASFVGALGLLSRMPKPQLESAFFGAVDLANHRVDAWFTSLASRRLASLRATNPTGVLIGDWGCLQDVRPANLQDPLQRAEFIHTPSLDQAAAAAVLRSAARRARASGSDHADIDLSSRRVRLARWLIEGIRNGRSLGELLGVRFERALKGSGGGTTLTGLRRQFASINKAGVLDGLRLHEEGVSSGSPASVVAAAGHVAETLDALADALTAEAVYQLVRGNPAGALIDLESIANGGPAPKLRVTDTPASGTRLTHRVVVTLPEDGWAPGWVRNSTPRSLADPLLDAWCGLVLGQPNLIVLEVEGQGGVTVPVNAAALQIGALDVVCAARDDASVLAQLTVAAARRARAGLANAVVRTNRAWKDLVGLCTAMLPVIAAADAVRADTFESPSALPAAADDDFGDLQTRFLRAQTTLSGVRDSLTRGTGAMDAVRSAAMFGIRVKGVAFDAEPSADQVQAVLGTVQARLAAASQAGNPRDRLRALFDGDVLGIVPVMARDPAALRTASGTQPAPPAGGEPNAVAAWLDAVGRVRPNVARFAEILQRVEVMRADQPALRVAQTPWRAGDRWIATAFKGTGRAPDGRLSVVVHAPLGIEAARKLGGFSIDAWAEHVPGATRDTAMALRYNSPSTRAPQTILLAVSPDPSQPWTTDMLVAALRDTLDLARLRMLPPPTWSRGGQMPLVWLGQRPNGAGISFAI